MYRRKIDEKNKLLELWVRRKCGSSKLECSRLIRIRDRYIWHGYYEVGTYHVGLWQIRPNPAPRVSPGEAGNSPRRWRTACPEKLREPDPFTLNPPVAHTQKRDHPSVSATVC